MHELGIAMEILRTCEEVLEREGPGRLERVKVVVGELSAVEPDLLSYAWEAAVSDSPHKDSKMEVTFMACRQLCPACDQEIPRETGQWHFACPHCEGALRIEGGRELGILEVTFDPQGEGVET
jgi:hydrogenase nickel incorporation protein HypA/HybF